MYVYISYHMLVSQYFALSYVIPLRGNINVDFIIQKKMDQGDPNQTLLGKNKSITVRWITWSQIANKGFSNPGNSDPNESVERTGPRWSNLHFQCQDFFFVPLTSWKEIWLLWFQVVKLCSAINLRAAWSASSALVSVKWKIRNEDRSNLSF